MDHFYSSQTDRYSPASLCKLSQQARLLHFEDAAQLLCRCVCVCVSEVNSYCVKNNKHVEHFQFTFRVSLVFVETLHASFF